MEILNTVLESSFDTDQALQCKYSMTLSQKAYNCHIRSCCDLDLEIPNSIEFINFTILNVFVHVIIRSKDIRAEASNSLSLTFFKFLNFHRSVEHIVATISVNPDYGESKGTGHGSTLVYTRPHELRHQSEQGTTTIFTVKWPCLVHWEVDRIIW